MLGSQNLSSTFRGAISEEVANAIEAAEFDAAKVEALRLAIMDGNYPQMQKNCREHA